MKCFVTGASGFIGSNLVQELLARGHRVKVLLRPGADVGGLLGLKFERVTGDILDRRLLDRELEGCDWCFHAAASYQLWLRDYAPMYAANVEGTRHVRPEEIAHSEFDEGRLEWIPEADVEKLPIPVTDREIMWRQVQKHRGCGFFAVDIDCGTEPMTHVVRESRGQ